VNNNEERVMVSGLVKNKRVVSIEYLSSIIKRDNLNRKNTERDIKKALIILNIINTDLKNDKIRGYKTLDVCSNQTNSPLLRYCA